MRSRSRAAAKYTIVGSSIPFTATSVNCFKLLNAIRSRQFHVKPVTVSSDFNTVKENHSAIRRPGGGEVVLIKGSVGSLSEIKWSYHP